MDVEVGFGARISRQSCVHEEVARWRTCSYIDL